VTQRSASAAASAHLCPFCGRANGCAMAAGADERCWCADADFSPASLERAGRAGAPARCICARCAAAGAQGTEETRRAIPDAR
jgi:hypothetical protein